MHLSKLPKTQVINYTFKNTNASFSENFPHAYALSMDCGLLVISAIFAPLSSSLPPFLTIALTHHVVTAVFLLRRSKGSVVKPERVFRPRSLRLDSPWQRNATRYNTRSSTYTRSQHRLGDSVHALRLRRRYCSDLRSHKACRHITQCPSLTLLQPRNSSCHKKNPRRESLVSISSSSRRLRIVDT